MEQVPTALHDGPLLAIDLVIAMAHTNNMYPLDNILEGCSLCYCIKPFDQPRDAARREGVLGSG